MEIWHHRMLITTFAASLVQRHSLAGNSLEGALELKLEDGFLMTAKPCNWVHLLLPFFTPYHYPENEKITILFIDIGVVWNRLLMTRIRCLWCLCARCLFSLTISASINGIGYFNWTFRIMTCSNNYSSAVLLICPLQKSILPIIILCFWMLAEQRLVFVLRRNGVISHIFLFS